MAVHEPARLDERDGRNVAGCDVSVEFAAVLEVRAADGGVGHDGRVVLERVADVAVLVRVGDGSAETIGRAHRAVVDLIFIFGDVAGFLHRWRCAERLGRAAVASVVVPLIAVVLPRNALRDEFVTDAGNRGGRNREDGVGGVGIQERVFAATEVAGVVVVQQVVVAGLAARIHWFRERREVFQNRGDAGLRGVSAIAVRAAAVRRRAERAAAVTIFAVPVIGAGCGVGIFDFIYYAGICAAFLYQHVVRWYLGIASAVGKVDGIAVTEHDVIGTGAAADGLVEVVAHGVGVGERLKVRSVTLLHVVEAESCRAFTSGRGAGQVVGVEVGWLRQAVGAGTDRDFDPREQAAVARRAIWPDDVIGSAIELLPHLVEAVHGAGSVRVVGEQTAVGQLEGTGREGIDVRDARVRNVRGQASAAGNQERVVISGQAGFGRFGETDAVAGDVRILRAADERGWKHIAAEIDLGRSQKKRIAPVFFAEVDCRELVGLCKVGSRSAIGLDDAF